MSFQFSIIIICKNEEHNIGQCLRSVHDLSDDIVVYDSGSTDSTVSILRQFPVQLHTGVWSGFGPTRQKAVDLAKHDWVLVVDADEVVSDGLRAWLQQLTPPAPDTAFRIRLKNHLGQRLVKWGAWGHDYRVRLYHKASVRWNELIVHERLVIPEHTRLINIHASLEHYTARSFTSLAQKMKQYALLTARQYHSQGKTSGWLKRSLGPGFAFFKSYIIKLGFLDGITGFHLASIISDYTLLKYEKLQEMEKKKEK